MSVEGRTRKILRTKYIHEYPVLRIERTYSEISSFYSSLSEIKNLDLKCDFPDHRVTDMLNDPELMVETSEQLQALITEVIKAVHNEDLKHKDEDGNSTSSPHNTPRGSPGGPRNRLHSADNEDYEKPTLCKAFNEFIALDDNDHDNMMQLLSQRGGIDGCWIDVADYMMHDIMG